MVSMKFTKKKYDDIILSRELQRVYVFYVGNNMQVKNKLVYNWLCLDYCATH